MAGANKLALGKRGELIVQTGNGPVTYTAPIAYQEDTNGKRSEIKVAYALNTDTHSHGFTVGDYNPEQALVIDPLLQSTYLGGAGEDIASALAIHPVSGKAYVAGNTESTNFPATTGGAQPAYELGRGLGGDAFVSLFNASLTTLLQSTYLGGAGRDDANALAIHPTSGEVVVVGGTTSATFPATLGGAQATHAGNMDVFITRLSPSLALVDAPGASTIPGAPVIGTATAGNAQATVGFTAPASNGGSAITGYTVTSSPGGITAIATAAPITVTGLTNGTAYTFTVTASNAVGQSAASGASNSVTPAATRIVPDSVPTSAPASGGGSTSVPMLLALSALYWWRRRGNKCRAGWRFLRNPPSVRSTQTVFCECLAACRT
ncbi:MAG: fibronectin type III domain-containing protein [Gammaproteobacteria bacterium]